MAQRAMGFQRFISRSSLDRVSAGLAGASRRPCTTWARCRRDAFRLLRFRQRAGGRQNSQQRVRSGDARSHGRAAGLPRRREARREEEGRARRDGGGQAAALSREAQRGQLLRRRGGRARRRARGGGAPAQGRQPAGTGSAAVAGGGGTGRRRAACLTSSIVPRMPALRRLRGGSSVRPCRSSLRERRQSAGLRRRWPALRRRASAELDRRGGTVPSIAAATIRARRSATLLTRRGLPMPTPPTDRVRLKGSERRPPSGVVVLGGSGPQETDHGAEHRRPSPPGRASKLPDFAFYANTPLAHRRRLSEADFAARYGAEQADLRRGSPGSSRRTA